MFWVYEITVSNSRTRFYKREQSNLFGCNKGIIAKLLDPPSLQGEPYPWHLAVESASPLKGKGFVIELKPKAGVVKSEFSFYQVCDAWGYSCDGWTPGMLRLKGLSVDGKPSINDPADFEIRWERQPENIFTFVYYAGSVRAGNLVGTWNAPRPSSTNSVLLWPEAFKFFTAEAYKFRAN
ncbi:MAG: hypothetical protein M3O30_04755 [Planctomycetota bacterium]|jgi:hypothetical protein|nr:hypothetical protein [Planctomycetota bacterium]